MTRAVPTSVNDKPATLRQLKLLVIVLVLSNVGLGILSVYLLRSVDRDYTELVDRMIPGLNDLRKLTTRVTFAQRSFGIAALFNAPESQRAGALEGARIALADQERLLNQVLAGSLLAPESAEHAALQRASADYSAKANELARFFSAGQIDDAARVRETALLPAFDHYLATIGRVADQMEKTSLRASEEATGRIGRLSTIVLGIASWPVIILMGLLLLTAVFVVVLMVLFRGRETSDMP